MPKKTKSNKGTTDDSEFSDSEYTGPWTGEITFQNSSGKGTLKFPEPIIVQTNSKGLPFARMTTELRDIVLNWFKKGTLFAKKPSDKETFFRVERTEGEYYTSVGLVFCECGEIQKDWKTLNCKGLLCGRIGLDELSDGFVKETEELYAFLEKKGVYDEIVIKFSTAPDIPR
eukprot:GHVP01067382.1.p1 GENE.GHVP01067382.1~~GHVP01067382.1.p1  ORF type:complete len:172 (-),score=34.95 GHVP01067382.1:48-563(-)